MNDDAVSALSKVFGRNSTHCFTYKGLRMGEVGEAWKRALKKADISDFRSHDLLQTWASWHVMVGTSLNELMELGGWKSYEMVLKYAHLNPQHLSAAAQNLKPVALALTKAQKNGA